MCSSGMHCCESFPTFCAISAFVLKGTSAILMCFNTPIIVCFSGIVIGVLVGVVGFLQTYKSFLAAAGLFGIFAGGFHAQRITVVSEFVPKHLLPDVVGISVFMQGLGNLFISPYGGTHN